MTAPQSPEMRVHVVLLAGSRPGTDPLASAAGVPTKALVPIGGRAMIDRVARTLVDHPRVGAVSILAQQGPDVLAATPETTWLATHPAIRFIASGAGISQSLLDLIDGHAPGWPLLVTTADNVLMDDAVIDAFLRPLSHEIDVAVGMVERRTLMAAYPGSRRTWLKFRGGWWSGANLFWLGSARARAAIALWRSVEQDRKKGWRVVGVFGPWLLAGAVLRLLTIDGAMARAGRALGLVARIVALPMAQACIDADKPDDITLIEHILATQDPL